jgi:hypothetical protein
MASCQVQRSDSEEGPVRLCHPPPLAFLPVQDIVGVILEARDEGNTGLHFGCLLTQIILQSGINITGEPKMKIQQPISKQTLMKSNAQQRRDDSDDEVPILVAMPVGFPDIASSSQTVPPSEPKFFSDNGGLSCHSGRNKHHATVHHFHVAGGALHQQACGAEPAGSQGMPQVS